MSQLQSIVDNYRGDRPLRTLLSLYRHDRRKLGLSMLFYVIKHSPEWLRPLIIANVIDIISHPDAHSLGELGLNGAILAAAVVQNLPTHYLHIRLMSTATRRMESQLRAAIARRLQSLSIGFYHRNSTGALQNKLLHDVEAVELLTKHLFQFLPSTVLTIVIALSVTAVRAPWFLLFFMATVPLAAVLIRTLKAPIRDRNHRLRQQLEGMSAHLLEMIKLLPITRAHGVEIAELERTERKLVAVQRAAMQVDSINAITNASSWVTLRLFGCVCLITAAGLVYRGHFGLTVGDVVLLTGYFDSLTNSVVQIMNVLPQLGKGFESIRSIGEVMECPDLEHNQGKMIVKQVRGEFTFNSVEFAYPDTPRLAVSDFSLHVEPGETIAFVGPSGAGKSTLLNLIIGFLRPTAGEILLDGCPLNRLDLRTYRRFLSVVAQETLLFEGTVRDNILYGMEEIDEQQLRQAIDDANAFEFISHLSQGLDTRIGENGVKLSGGQRQRLAIARALIRNPRVLILDEATASLDTASETLIQEALERLMKNRTTFVVAHRLSTIRQATRIVVLAEGRIVEIGNHRQLLANQGLFAKLHALQT